MKIKRLLSITLCIATVAATVGCSMLKTSKETVIISTDSPHYSTIEDLTKKADLVINGTVLSSKVKELNDLILPNIQDEKLNPGGKNVPSSMNVYTVYTVKVNDAYKGNINSGDIIEIKVRGGQLNDKNYIYEDGIKFANNKKYIMFLATFPNSPACLLNPIQASYTDEKDEEGNFKSAHKQNNLKVSPKYLEQIKQQKK